MKTRPRSEEHTSELQCLLHWAYSGMTVYPMWQKCLICLYNRHLDVEFVDISFQENEALLLHDSCEECQVYVRTLI